LGKDYIPHVGGVVPMMRALLQSGHGSWIANHPRWVALGAPGLPREFRTDEGYVVETVPLDLSRRAAYVEFKEVVWRSFHGPRGLEPFAGGAYRAFVEYNYLSAHQLLRHVTDYDLFYINDFQQILVGSLIGSAAPAILRWHIPLEFRGYPEPVRRFFVRAMEGFDAIVVSTRAGLEELIRRGFHGRAFQVYPYLNPSEQGRATDGEVETFRSRFGLGSAPYVLSVGRLDPVKRQDLLIEAFARLRRSFPDLRLVLAGGGSFSTRRFSAGRTQSKEAGWEFQLRRKVRALRIESSVVITGGLSHGEIRAAYDGASAFVHPAPWEGFGLVVVEAWMHRLPVVVSRGAGVSELVNDGVNGYATPPGSVSGLATRLGQLLRHPEAAWRMGEAGAATARSCYVQQSSKRLREIFSHTIEMYSRSGSLHQRFGRV
jgi:glycosyltransferase involved in cell wall biosynthesis